MFIWIDIILVILAVVFLYIGIRLWKESAQPEQQALSAFTEKRNAISCFSITILCAMIELCLNL